MELNFDKQLIDFIIKHRDTIRKYVNIFTVILIVVIMLTLALRTLYLVVLYEPVVQQTSAMELAECKKMLELEPNHPCKEFK